MHAGLLCAWLVLALIRQSAADQWPQFRGPNADGHTRGVGLPVTWSDTKNVQWKTPIRGRGWSSPVVWGRQIWLTTATEDGREQFVVCVDRESGKVLLDTKLFDNPDPDPIADINSYASPTPVIEDGRVYVHFGSYGTACLDTKRLTTLWTRRDLRCTHSVGPGSSPVLYAGLLILTMDGIDYQYTVALDKKTGRSVWKTDRSVVWKDGAGGSTGAVRVESRKSFNTPTIVNLNGLDQMISPGAKAVYGYDPKTGRELWRVPHDGYSNSARTLVGHGLAFVNTGYDRSDLIAVRLDGMNGDVNGGDHAVAWKYSRNVPFKPSALLVDDLLYLINDAGIITCLEAKTGEEVWKERIDGNYSASPLYADGRIFLFSEQGKTTVLQPGRKLQVLAESQLPAGFMASPAVTGKALILRTKTHLYRVEL